MESNEQDNRQMTVIATALEREKKLMNNALERHHKYGLTKSVYEAHKENVKFLESLLPKERYEIIKQRTRANAIEDGITSGRDEDAWEAAQKRAEDWFNETFKQG